MGVKAWGSERNRTGVLPFGLPALAPVGGSGPHLFPALSLLEEGLNHPPAPRNHMLSGSGLASPSLQSLLHTALEKCLSKISWQVLLGGPGHLLWFPGCCKHGAQASYPALDPALGYGKGTNRLQPWLLSLTPSTGQAVSAPTQRGLRVCLG